VQVPLLEVGRLGGTLSDSQQKAIAAGEQMMKDPSHLLLELRKEAEADREVWVDNLRSGYATNRQQFIQLLTIH
jgi:hypothetical protein